MFDPSRLPISSELQSYIADELKRIIAFEAKTKRRVRLRKVEDHKRFERVVSAILCDLAHAHLEERGSWRYATFSKEILGRAGRGPDFITETFPGIVRLLSEPAIALVEYEPGRYSPFGGRCTTLRAGKILRSAIRKHGFHFGDLKSDLALRGESIRLRGPKQEGKKRGAVMLVPLGEPADGFRREVDQLNQWYDKADLACDVLPDGRRCDLSSRYLRRHFNNGRMDHGGRFFGAFWLDMKAAHRLQCLTINGERVVSLDFGQCAVRIAYGHAGVSVPAGDLYGVGNLSRDGVKKVMNALLHSSKELSRFPRDTRPDFGPGFGFHQVVRIIQARHAPIAHLFGTGFGMTGFFIESQVIVKSLLELMDMGIVALPVHDCVVVPRSAALAARDVLLKTFTEVTGAVGEVEMEQDKYATTRLPQ
ncbi:hypothetical protein [Rhodanobacter sp. L36]|uniref:hypothetical protein n=1 Tax=Rhodanobacter sp. L36 TaxID=1747221 RepID=UPI00131D37B4|nr:hypothetical protein [Rhodanobacter sp. L36]